MGQIIHFLLVLLLVELTPTVTSVEVEVDCYGTEFLIAFLENVPVKSPKDIEIHVTTQSTGNVTVCAEAPLMPTVAKVCGWTTFGKVTALLLPNILKLKGSAIQSKGVLVTATEDIVAYGVNKESYSNDAFLALPVDSLGTEYLSMHAVPSFSNPDSAEFVVVGTENLTVVDVYISSLPNIIITYNGVNYTTNDSLQVTLDRYETLQLQSLYDMTGTRVVASKPVAFISGNRKTSVGAPLSSGDHLTEQIPPLQSWGSEFLVVALQGRFGGDLIRIIAAKDDTDVTIMQTPSNTSAQRNVRLGKGEFVELDAPSSTTHSINSTSPVAVFQLCKTNSVDKTHSDPFLMYIPSVDQFMDSYTFTTIESALTTAYIDRVNLFIQASDMMGLRLDGQPLKQANYSILGAPGGNVGIQLTVTAGTHQLSHVNGVPFGAFMYGQTKLESYGFPAGMKVAVNKPTSNSSSSTGYTFIYMSIGILAFALAVMLGALLLATGCCCCGPAAARRKRSKKAEEVDDLSRLHEDAKRKKKEHKKKKKKTEKARKTKVMDITPPITPPASVSGVHVTSGK